MRFGLHVSIAGGLPNAVDRAVKLGCEAFQIFVGNPRGWQSKESSKNEIFEFRNKRDESGLTPVVVHMPYLPNLASDKTDLLEKSVEVAQIQLQRAEAIGADFLVCHMGKAKDAQGMDRMLDSVLHVLGSKPRKCRFLLENTAGQGSEMGTSMEEIGGFLRRLGREDTGLCLDTCHAHAAGYDLSKQSGLKKLKDEILQYVDKSNLMLVHLNDALKPSGSRVDRHFHIGQGTITPEGLGRFMRWDVVRNLAAILETPRKCDEDDLKNLEAIRSYESTRRK